jgi:hypothetical protein
VTDSRATKSTPSPKTGKKAVAASKTAPPAEPTHRHPNLGLAPVNMAAGLTDAAERLRHDRITIAAQALIAATEADPTIKDRYDEVGLRRLLHDGEILVERLAMCMASDDSRWLAGFAEWIAPIYRRRGVTLLDLATLCTGIRVAVEPNLSADELACAARALDAATAVLRRNSRIAGDRHKRNALWKWMYRGV